MSSHEANATTAEIGPGPSDADISAALPGVRSPVGTILEFIQLLRGRRCGAAPAGDEIGPPGVAIDRHAAARPVIDVHGRGADEILPDDPLELVQERLGDQMFRCFLAIDSDGRLVGIVALSDRVRELPEVDLAGIIVEAGRRTS